MRYPLSLPKRVLLFMAGSTFALNVARAQLPLRSPFLPTEAEISTTADAPRLEFFGLIEDNHDVRFRVNDTARKTGAWLRLDERSPDLDVTVRGYDDERELLTVEQQGRRLTLAQRRPKIANVSMAGVQTQMGAIGATSARPITSAVLPPTTAPGDLEQLAAAVAQRRAARGQGTPTPSTPSK